MHEIRSIVVSRTETASALYVGKIRHRRFLPKSNEFRYRLFMAYLDLDELDNLLPESVLWSRHRPALVRFRREDYFGDPQKPLGTAIRDEVEARSGQRPSGPIRMLTHLRYFGHCFNPVSFYYCFDREGTRVETIVADITNTPWNERYAYILTPKLDKGEGGMHRYIMPKVFHVSPFMEMDHEYDWRFSEPGDKLWVHFENWQKGAKSFDASLTLSRRPFDRAGLTRAVARFPLMTVKVISAIYWQALRLFIKRVPFVEHPKHRSNTSPE
ncbi:DUF1365 family protein [candidate division GN15 bacterium]|nr:DUF1365 family protein [candidate division GN15 bacterium]